MREIKFRGMTKGNKWLYGYLTKYVDYVNGIPFAHHIIFTNLDSFLTDNYSYVIADHSVNEKTIGQFTGFYDKNGKEIYEGDIVEFSECVTDYPYQTHKIVVYYDEVYATFYPLRDYYYCDFEVIGNIYDNPELLREK